MGVRLGLCGRTVSMDRYVQRFGLLEVQHTFYQPPADALLARWRAQVPAGFEFTLKAWQLVTHESGSPTCRRLKRPLPEEHKGQVGAFRTTDEELRRLHALVRDRPAPYVLCNNLPRVGDAERFAALLSR